VLLALLVLAVVLLVSVVVVVVLVEPLPPQAARDSTIAPARSMAVSFFMLSFSSSNFFAFSAFVFCSLSPLS
jgi:hypothetical protein